MRTVSKSEGSITLLSIFSSVIVFMAIALLAYIFLLNSARAKFTFRANSSAKICAALAATMGPDAALSTTQQILSGIQHEIVITECPPSYCATITINKNTSYPIVASAISYPLDSNIVGAYLVD